jgi:hypothetical protein
VVATEVSGTSKIKFAVDYPRRRTTSNHSGKYYAAAYDNPRLPGQILQIWDIATGNTVQKISGPLLPDNPNAETTDIMVVAKQGPGGAQQVVIAGRVTSSNRNRGSLFGGQVSALRVVPIDSRSSE